MRRGLTSFVLVSVVAAAGVARAQSPDTGPTPSPDAAPLEVAVRLHLVLGQGAERCPPETRLHRAAASEIGYDPFELGTARPSAGDLRVEIVEKNGSLEATVHRVGADGKAKWPAPRTFVRKETSAESCLGLMRAIAHVLAWELTVFDQPAGAPAEPAPPVPPPQPSQPPAPPPTEPVPPAPPPPPPPPHRWLYWRGEVGLAGFASFGAGAPINGGGALHIGVSIAPFGPNGLRLGLAGEARTDAAVTDAYGARTQLFGGSLLACGSKDFYERSPLTLGTLACLVGTGGALSVSQQGHTPFPSDAGSATAHDAYGGAGLRLALDIRFGATMALRPQVDALLTVAQAGGFSHSHQEVLGSLLGNAGVAAYFLF